MTAAPDMNDVLREDGPEAVRKIIDEAPVYPGPKAGHGRAGKADSQPLLQSSAAFVRGFVPPDYVIDGIIQCGFFYSFTGKTGSGKTAIALVIAASVALGRNIGNNEVTKGRVLYFAGENPDDIRMRWIALAKEMNFDIETIDVHFIPNTFKISQMISKITEEVKALRPVALIIVDTSAAFFEGDDENNNVQAATHARRLRSLVDLRGRPCVLTCCHPVKNAGEDNLLPRGGGAFVAEVDGNLTARKDGSVVEVHWLGKHRGPDFVPISFMLRTVNHERLKDSKGRLIPTVIAGHLSEAGQDELAAVARTNENKLLKVLSENDGASYADLARLLGWKLGDGEPHKMMVKRTLDKLKAQKLVTVEQNRPVLTSKGMKAIK
jgi:AAA domain